MSDGIAICAGADIKPRFEYFFGLHAKDAREGLAAHVERRKPVFKGR